MTGGYFSDELKPSSERTHQYHLQTRIKQVTHYNDSLRWQWLHKFAKLATVKVILDAKKTQNVVVYFWKPGKTENQNLENGTSLFSIDPCKLPSSFTYRNSWQPIECIADTSKGLYCSNIAKWYQMAAKHWQQNKTGQNTKLEQNTSAKTCNNVFSAAHWQ